MGFSATGEYFLRILDPRHAGSRPYTPWWQMTGQGDTVTMHGAYLQMGYMLPIPGLENKLEAVGRVGGVSLLGNGQGRQLGIFCRPETTSSKVTRSNCKRTSPRFMRLRSVAARVSLANVNDDALIWRVQLQVAF